MQVPPEPAKHVASVASMSTVVTPGEPVVELGEFVLPCQVHLLIWLPCSCQKRFILKSIWTVTKIWLCINIGMSDNKAVRKLDWPYNCQMQLQLNVDQSPDIVPRKSSVKYYVHSGCSKMPARTSVNILHTGWFTWTIRNRCAHVHEAEGTTWQRFPAARATGDFWLSGWAADPVLAEAAALVRHCRAAVGNGLPAEVAAHKHLSQKNKHKGRLISRWTWR